MKFGYAIAELGQKEVDRQVEAVVSTLPIQAFPVFGDLPKFHYLWWFTRSVLGKDTPNYPQEIGSCVAFGGKNAREYRQAVEIANGDREQWFPVSTMFYYHTMRNLVGKNRISGDGGIGAWMAKAVQDHGTLKLSEAPPYSGSLERKWGSRSPLSEEIYSKAKPFITDASIPVLTLDQLDSALASGCPVTVASNVGFSMEPRSGFHADITNWAHQMCFIGFNSLKDYYYVLNSWGDVHGSLRDLETDEIVPQGVLRIRKQAAQKMLNAKDSFAFGNSVGYERKKIDFSLVIKEYT